MGYDTMASWSSTVWNLGETIHRSSRAGSITEGGLPRLSCDYRVSSPSPVELPAPSFRDATSSWSPPQSPTSGSPNSTTLNSPTSPHSPRVDSAHPSNSPATIHLTAKEKRQLADKLYSAACAGDLDHIKLLLHIGAPIDFGTVVEGLYEAFKPAKSGRLSPLAGAAGQGQAQTVELLCSRGASVNPTNGQSSSSPLHQAIRANDVSIACFLLERGADVNGNNSYKTTPLMYAVKYGSTDMVRLILSYRPNHQQLSFVGAAAIHWSVWPDRPEIMELVLQAGANKDHAMADGSTPLHCAAIGGYVGIVKCLLRHGADPLRRNDDWKTPLQTAEESGHVEIVRLMREAALRKRRM